MTRPQWLPPTWIALTLVGRSKAATYIDTARIVAVSGCEGGAASVFVDGGAEFVVAEDPKTVVGLWSRATL